ncbi:hypothetical protein RND81_05G027100 [Saponaria officinalis]|uniref:Uncharacterized protein n=1 Tax=Saponaria officinalis TaxID=3572 RepID=A0AAW1KQE1_SAPOF
MSLLYEQIKKVQNDIDMIKDHAPNFVARLNLVMPESVYMNMLNCPLAITMLNAVISGEPNAVLTQPITDNFSLGIKNLFFIYLILFKFLIFFSTCLQTI